MNLTLKNIKHFAAGSEETECFNATVCLDGKPIGTVKNAGHGGCNDYYWTDREAGARVEAWVKTQTYECPYTGDTAKLDLDIPIGDLLAQHLKEKQFKTWCRTKIVFRHGDTPKDQWLTMKGKFCAAAKAALMMTHPKIVEFLNERFA